MRKYLNMVVEKCTGCRQCELACSFRASGNFNPAKSLIRAFIFDEQARYVPFTCLQCEEAWCMTSCPVQAIKEDSLSGAKVVREDLCVGCKVCTVACPFGTIFYNSQTGKAVKCDLCAGTPECVKSCPTAAIEYRPIDTIGFTKMKDWANRLEDAYRREVLPK